MTALCQCGEIGKHNRLKICRSQGLVGSSPTTGTTFMTQLDCDTPKGQQFIKKQHEVERWIEKRFDVEVKTSTNKIEKYDAGIYRNDNLSAVCEIKTREFWNRKKKEPFTVERMKQGDYLITAEKLDVLQRQSKLHGIPSLIFLRIPYDNKVAMIQVTDKHGNFMIDFETRVSRTFYSINDEKGKTPRSNAFIKYSPKVCKFYSFN